MGKSEVTQAEYQAVIGSNPSHFAGDSNLPVESVSWVDATHYCATLTARERAAGRIPDGYLYRLPTEAEWEYACRAGTTTATAFGDRLDPTQANFGRRYPFNGAATGTTNVGSYTPNAWGLHDMHGNVEEWCADWYAETYPGGSVVDPMGPATGSERVIRGGSWFHDESGCRSATRERVKPDAGRQGSFMGFRVVLAPNQP
jgi:formylglycine-generating enzyme required for sulfatase activity